MEFVAILGWSISIALSIVFLCMAIIAIAGAAYIDYLAIDNLRDNHRRK